MSVEIISKKIIRKLISLPVDLEKNEGDSDLPNFWEQYKEQLQFQLYLNYDIFEDNIRDMAYDEINELSNEVIKQIFTSIASSYNPLRWVPAWEVTPDCYSPPATFEDKRKHLVDTIILYVQTFATSEEVVHEHILTGHKQENESFFRSVTLEQAEEARNNLRQYFAQLDNNLIDNAPSPKVEYEKYSKDRAVLMNELTKRYPANQILCLVGITVSNYHFECGTTSFSGFAVSLTQDIGAMIKPYLKFFYSLIRCCPDVKEGMDDDKVLCEANIEEITGKLLR